MKIRVYYEFEPSKDDEIIDINENELIGKSDKEQVEYIFEKYVEPFVRDHLVLSYDVIPNSVI